MFRRSFLVALLSMAANTLVESKETVTRVENYPINFCTSYTNVCNDLQRDLECPKKTNTAGLCQGLASYGSFDVSSAFGGRGRRSRGGGAGRQTTKWLFNNLDLTCY